MAWRSVQSPSFVKSSRSFTFVKMRSLATRGDPQPDRRGRHPAIRLVSLLAQAMPGPDTPGAKRGVCLDKVRPRPDDLRPGYLILQPTQLPGTPTSQPGTISQLSHGDEGDDSWSPGKERA